MRLGFVRAGKWRALGLACGLGSVRANTLSWWNSNGSDRRERDVHLRNESEEFGLRSTVRNAARSASPHASPRRHKNAQDENDCVVSRPGLSVRPRFDVEAPAP